MSHARKTKKLRAKPGSRRGDPVTYHLTDAEGRDNAVCENFFLNTLNISKQAIHWNLKRANNGTVQKPPKRIPHNEVGEEVIQSIKSHHIESTNKVESHYCRSSTKREEFEAGLSIPDI